MKIVDNMIQNKMKLIKCNGNKTKILLNNINYSRWILDSILMSTVDLDSTIPHSISYLIKFFLQCQQFHDIVHGSK